MIRSKYLQLVQIRPFSHQNLLKSSCASRSQLLKSFILPLYKKRNVPDEILCLNFALKPPLQARSANAVVRRRQLLFLFPFFKEHKHTIDVRDSLDNRQSSNIWGMGDAAKLLPHFNYVHPYLHITQHY